MKIDGDYIVFESGKKQYALCGVISLAPDLSIHSGWDDDIYLSYRDDNDLTKEELIELADFMIASWKNFKEKQKGVA